MNKAAQPQLADVKLLLDEATRQNSNGQHGAALKQAYHACEHVASAYLFKITGKSWPPDDVTFELFYETIQEPGRHPDLLLKIEDVVGDVFVLREAYEPAILNEASAQDAQQMITHVGALNKLIGELIARNAVG
jgi:hypothetical protein